MHGKELLQQMRDEAVYQLDWFTGPCKTNSDIIAYIIACELRKHDTGDDDISEEEANEIIQKTRGSFIPLVKHFLLIDEAIKHERGIQ